MMKRTSFKITLFLGICCSLIQFRSIKPNLWLEEVLFTIPFLILCILAVAYLINDTRRYDDGDGVVSYLPSCTAILFISVIFIHIYHRSSKGFGKTSFIATNEQFSHGLEIDFKANQNLKITQYHKFGETEYFGGYSISGDTVFLDINTDFQLGDKAILTDDTLYFKKQKLAFSIRKPAK
ncbi:hypothetical protein [Rufibacter ruber]|uniref:hypothetical protein n=1 Tax=Rufibacter ruber TaxID=1783499 RepID=UPI0012902061|nr:hypothetical protein [Rufibacter ruber]